MFLSANGRVNTKNEHKRSSPLLKRVNLVFNVQLGPLVKKVWRKPNNIGLVYLFKVLYIYAVLFFP